MELKKPTEAILRICPFMSTPETFVKCQIGQCMSWNWSPASDSGTCELIDREALSGTIKVMEV
jgi:hypothetical protein